LRSVLLFGSNDLELSGDDVSVKWLAKSFEDLSEAQKTAFWDYKIVVRDVSGASDLEIRDLFRRLNIHAVILNDQELRHAKHSGRFIQAMETLADDEWWLNAGIVSVRQIRRMEDVEYISELFIGLIAGPQDKKKNIDEYYANFDAVMPQKNEWVEQFEQTRDFTKSLLSEAELRRWSGKSDFYTLFLAMAPLAQRKPRLSTAEKASARSELAAFRDQVDQAKRKDNTRIFPSYIQEYVEAVTRAATDLGRRETRLRVLEDRLASSLKKAGAAKTNTKKSD